MKVATWLILFDSLWDDGVGEIENVPYLIPGANTKDWTNLLRHDYDEVDRMYTESETIGGA